MKQTKTFQTSLKSLKVQVVEGNWRRREKKELYLTKADQFLDYSQNWGSWRLMTSKLVKRPDQVGTEVEAEDEEVASYSHGIFYARLILFARKKLRSIKNNKIKNNFLLPMILSVH